MKVVRISGSPKASGNTVQILQHVVHKQLRMKVWIPN